MYKSLPFFEKTLRLIPAFWRKLEANIPLPEIEEDNLVGHAVIVGYGQVGKHLVDVLKPSPFHSLSWKLIPNASSYSTFGIFRHCTVMQAILK